MATPSALVLGLAGILLTTAVPTAEARGLAGAGSTSSLQAATASAQAERPGRNTEPEPAPIPVTLAEMASVLSDIVPKSDVVAAARTRAMAAVSALRELASKWPAQSPVGYRRNLRENLTALKAAFDAVAAVQARIVDALAEDMEAKLEHCRASGGRLGGAVTVRVRTVGSGGEARDWQVLYLPKILELSKATPDRFPRLSSPTEESFVPGRYVMWGLHPGTNATSERIVVKVGEGRSELVVDLPVPPSSKP